MARAEERGHRDQQRAPVRRARVGRGCPTSSVERAPRRRSARLLPPLPRVRPPLPPAPAQRARGAGPRRQVAHRPAARGCACSRELTSAITVDLDGEAVSLEQGLSRLHVARPRGAARRGRGGHRRRWSPGCGRAGSCSTRCSSTSRSTTGCAATPTGSRAGTSTNEASDESVQALVDAVQSRYDIPQRWYSLKARLLGLDQHRRLRPHGVGRVGPTRSSAGTRPASWCSTRTRRSRRSSPTSRERFFDEAWIDAPIRPGKRPGAFCAYTVPSRTTRTCCSTGPRADATCSPSPTRWVTACTRTSPASRGSSTRPHRSPWPRPRRCSARPSRSGASSTRPPTRPRASRSSPRASKGRSRPCSARSR